LLAPEVGCAFMTLKKTMSQKFAIISLVFFGLIAMAQESKPKPKTVPATTSSSATHHGDTSLPSEDVVNAFLQQTFGYDPQLTWKIVSIKPSKAEGLAEVNVQMSSPQGQGGQRFFVSADGNHAVVGDIIPFGRHPFEATRLELQKKVTGPSRGPADASVMIVEFSDLQCPHCKEANPTIERLLKEEPNIHFVLQSFPLPMHNWAAKAAAYADCTAKLSGDAFWKFNDNVYQAQAEITAENADQKLTELADKAGVKGADVAACSTQSDTQGRVEASVNLGKSVDVNSTPTLFINGRPVGVSGNNYDVLKQLVDFAAKQK
jgi:protein-disulfide isomerase